jgi:hypothetical protein
LDGGRIYKMFCVCVFMGKVLKIVGIVVLVLVVLIVGIGIYFYNYHVFKTVRVCIGDGVDSGVLCNVTQDCVDLVGEQQNFETSLDGAPNFVKENFQNIVDEAIYCDGVCFVRNIRGVNYETGELEDLESCDIGEVEFVMEIRGKEGVEILKYLRGMK